MRRFAELAAALAVSPARARRAWLAEYLAAMPDPERGWAVGWLLGALQGRRVGVGRLRRAAEARAGAEMFRLSAAALGDVGETVALIWPGGGDLPLSVVVAGLDAPEALLDRLDAEPRLALVRLLTGRPAKGARFAEIRDALAGLGGAPPGLVAGALVAEAPPYPGLFAWLSGEGPPPAAEAPRPPRLLRLAPEAPPPGDRGDWRAWPLPDGEPVARVGGALFDAEGAPAGRAPGPDGWGFLSQEGFAPAGEGAALSGPWEAIRKGPLLLERGGDWAVWPAPERRAVCPVAFVELGAGATLTLAVQVGGEIAPLVKLPAPDPARAARFARATTVEKFGPVRRVGPGLWAEVAYGRTLPAPRRKCGIRLEGARIVALMETGPPPPELDDL